jgi:vacuolar-type H+-ATPase subunit I/STV1
VYNAPMKRLWLALFFAVVFAGVAVPSAAMAVNNGGTSPKFNDVFSNDKCGGVQIALPFIGSNKCVNNDPKTGGAIVNYLKTILLFLSGAIGLIVMLMLVIGGINYITSTGDPARIKGAKDMIQNAIVALVLFLCMFAIISFILPGGVLQ